jgi:hypothetical protein
VSYRDRRGFCSESWSDSEPDTAGRWLRIAAGLALVALLAVLGWAFFV